MTAARYDLVVLGGGAAAFAAITEANRRGLTTAMVNADLPLGGTCVNVGCIPSKHLLEVAKTAFEPPRSPFGAVQYEPPTTDWETAIAETHALVDDLRQENYVDVARAFGTDVFHGHGRFDGNRSIHVVDGEDEGVHVEGEKTLVATGSSPRIPQIRGIDGVPYETSETILDRPDLPAQVVMLGGGYVGMEWGQILHRMGSDVTILQRSSRVLSEMEPELGRELARCLRGEGIDVVTDVGFDGVRAEEELVVDATVRGEKRAFSGSDLFVATGVRPNTHDIGLDRIGVETDESGAISVDDEFRTANSDVYAAGDVIGDPMLETTAAREGSLVVRNAFGDERESIDYAEVPKVVYTSPEVASVGVTEAEYMAEHGTCTCRTIDVADLPKARAVGDDRGLVKVVKHHETDAVVGVHAVAQRAADMITEATLAVAYGLTVDEVIDTVHPFPTFSEAIKRACQAFRRDVTVMACCVE